MPRSKEHHYQVYVRWTGNRGEGTSSYRAYGREHEISAEGKATIQASADPAFRGDPSLYNPEELLVAALSGCHMLSYLHACAVAGVVVTDYEDDASGTMEESGPGEAQFSSVVLRPTVTIRASGDSGEASKKAMELHERAHHLCFIARSVNFPVSHEPRIVVGE